MYVWEESRDCKSGQAAGQIGLGKQECMVRCGVTMVDTPTRSEGN